MTSESVWFEQVDTALIGYTTSIVKLPNSSGLLVPVPVKIRKPEEDFKVEEYPCITFYNLYSSRDNFRFDPEPVIVSRNADNNSLVQEKSAIPYSLYYQMDFWSRRQVDMNAMTRLWLSHQHDKYFNLPVKDVSGNNRSCFALITDDLKKIDALSGTDRTFHSVITYRIWVELDEKVRYTGDMITEVVNQIEQD